MELLIFYLSFLVPFAVFICIFLWLFYKDTFENEMLATSSLVWQAVNKICQDINQGNLITISDGHNYFDQLTTVQAAGVVY